MKVSLDLSEQRYIGEVPHISSLKSLNRNLVKVLVYVLVNRCVFIYFNLVIVKSVVHPEKGHMLILEQSLLQILTVLIHWQSYQVKVAIDFLVMSTTL